MRQIKKIVVHCTASPDTMDLGLKEIDQWHRQWGWDGCGYHWIVRRDGTCEAGRPESKIGSHVKGHNRDSIGIVWVGTNEITLEQKKTLDRIIRGILKTYNLSINDVYGHYELDTKKTCPNLDMDGVRKSLRTEKYLPEGPSEDEIEISLIDIENQVLEEE